jgi:tRNA dimethylallyltransferase
MISLGRSEINNGKHSIVVLAGATGSGKTALTIALANSENVPDIEIISADSRQIYRGMNIGTDKVSSEIQSLIPHHLIDLINPDKRFSAADFVLRANRCIEDIVSRGKLPFVAGGTGLYIRALTGGLAGVAGPNSLSREKYKHFLKAHGNIALHELLKKKDHRRAADIHPTDTFRLIRALEIIDSGQENLSGILNQHAFEERPYRFLKCVLSVDRKKLYRRIEMRVDDMISRGLVNEVMDVRNEFGRDAPALDGIGYSQIGRYLDGEISLDEAIRIIKRDSRHYAKRQITWFKKEPKSLFIQHDPDSPEIAVGKLTDLIGSFYERRVT